MYTIETVKSIDCPCLQCWEAFATPKVCVEHDGVRLDFRCSCANVVEAGHSVEFRVFIPDERARDDAMISTLISGVTCRILSVCRRCMELQTEPRNEGNSL